MKTCIISLILFHSVQWIYAREPEIIYVHPDVSTHFITSEPIAYVDISTDGMVGDLPAENILRIKPLADNDQERCMLTIVCQKYIIQYQLKHSEFEKATTCQLISSMDGTGLMHPEITLSTTEMKTICKQIQMKKRRKPVKRAVKYGIRVQVDRIYTAGDYFFMEVTVHNQSRIAFDLDQVRFQVQDKKVLKSTNFQSIEVKPVYQLYHPARVKRKCRNIYVFRRFTFPNEKTFRMEVTEKQLSGRRVVLNLDYRRILQADPM